MFSVYVFAATLVSWLGAVLMAEGFDLSPFVVAALLAALRSVGFIEWPWAWVILPLWAVIGAIISNIWIVARYIIVLRFRR
jgi:hypothetical protein